MHHHHPPMPHPQATTVIRGLSAIGYRLSGILISLLLTTMPLAAHAQEQSTSTVIITIRDVHGDVVRNATLTLFSETGTQDAEGQPDASGRTTFTGIPAGKKRLLVRGALADGTPLIQEGFDETGMILFVDGSSASVDLVVEPRGAVIFDPAMITPDEPIAAYPTAIELPGTAIAASPTPNMSPTAAPAAAEPRLLATDTPKPTSTPPVMPSTPPRRPTIPWQAAGFVGVAFIIGLVVFRKQ